MKTFEMEYQNRLYMGHICIESVHEVRMPIPHYIQMEYAIPSS